MIAVLGYEVRRSRVWEGNVERWLLKRQRANQQMRVLKRKFERVVVQSQKLSESTLEGKSVHLGGEWCARPVQYERGAGNKWPISMRQFLDGIPSTIPILFWNLKKMNQVVKLLFINNPVERFLIAIAQCCKREHFAG